MIIQKAKGKEIKICETVEKVRLTEKCDDGNKIRRNKSPFPIHYLLFSNNLKEVSSFTKLIWITFTERNKD